MVVVQRINPLIPRVEIPCPKGRCSGEFEIEVENG